MQNKKNTTQVKPFCRFLFVTVFLLLHGYVWAGKADTAFYLAMQQRDKLPTKASPPVGTSDKVDRTTSVNQRNQPIETEKKSVRQIPKANPVITTNDKKVPQTSKNRQIQSDNKEKINDEKLISKKPTKKPGQPVSPIETEQKTIRQVPKDKPVVTTNDKKVPKGSENRQIQSENKETINEDKLISKKPTKKPGQPDSPIETEKKTVRQVPKDKPVVTTNDKKVPQTSENRQAQSDNKEKNKKVCTASSGKAPEMVIIPAGTFMMGSIKSDSRASETEKPQHKVTITRPFAMGRCEVTFADYALFTHATGGDLPEGQAWGEQNHPVINVSWNDAQAYVRWLSQATGRRYRLPTEAEWEYVARAGTTTRYWWGDDVGENLAVCDGCGSSWDNKQTAPVASFAANNFGFYDIAGNVYEWVQDCWHGKYDKAAPKDGSAWEGANSGDCGRRVLRGGSWLNSPWGMRSADRYNGGQGDYGNWIGFRLAQDLN